MRLIGPGWRMLGTAWLSSADSGLVRIASDVLASGTLCAYSNSVERITQMTEAQAYLILIALVVVNIAIYWLPVRTLYQAYSSSV
jgi:hypothetical protein